ncbi:hypothetical protein JCM10908_005934 [Rhodotorula pacifica]|uniref:uncharacterized protein n=1 Tax=Rhodotorula pacifica TaxID=1495444 RepID=UPI00316B1141
MATAAPPPPSETKPKPGLWDSLTPSEQKKAVTVFLCSLGVTLLITGRSGGKLLKRAKATEASAAGDVVTSGTNKEALKTVAEARRTTPPAAAAAAAAAPPPASSTFPVPPAPTASTSTAAALTSRRRRPQAPPISILHPNSLTPPKPRRRLLASFILPAASTSASSPSVLPSSSRPPAPSSYFLPNPTIVATSTAFAEELDKYDKLHEDGEELPAPPPEDGFNPTVFAMKALGIATLLSAGTFAAGIYGVMRYLGVDDVESLALALQHRLPSVFDAHRPSIPDWATPSSSSSSSPPPAVETSSLREQETEAEELSYWSSIKETLDREAEENRREKRSAWEERVRRRAAALGGNVAGDDSRQV